MLRSSILALLLFTSSCALFQDKKSLKQRPIEDLLQALHVNGEGRGRLGVDKQSYVFSFETVLKENFDWILAASIPLHGEEVMILRNLKREEPVLTTKDSFEARIEREINAHFKGKDRTLGRKFLNELRALMRFSLARELDLDRSCHKKADQYICKIGDSKFDVVVLDKELRIKREIEKTHYLELQAQNFSADRFGRSNYFLHSKKQKEPILSLELFWK